MPQKKSLKKSQTATQEEGFESEPYSKDTFKGKINDEYAIEMVLYRLDGHISGEYRYISNNKWISLQRAFPDQASSSIVLEERIDDKITGTFAGTFTDTDYSGTWISADGETRYPFLVQLISSTRDY